MKSILISEELHTKFKTKVAKEKGQMKEIVEGFIRGYLINDKVRDSRIKEALFQVMVNDTISASAAGLGERKTHRDMAKKLLRNYLGWTEEKANNEFDKISYKL